MEASGKVKCPFCGSSKVEFFGMEGTNALYHCSECGREFTTGRPLWGLKSLLALWGLIKGSPH